MQNSIAPDFEARMLRATGAQIRRIRNVLHMTQEELALKAGHGLTAEDIDTLENGQNDMFMVPFFHVCEALGISPNDVAVEQYAEKMMPEEFAQWDEKEREAALTVAAFHSVHRDWWTCQDFNRGASASVG